MKKKIIPVEVPRARWKKWALRCVVAFGVPLLMLALVEASLRLGGYGSSSDFFVADQTGTNLLINEDFLRQFYSGNAAKGKTQPFVIPAIKPPGTSRIFILGESAALGTPEPAFGFARILEHLLRSQFPQRRFEVVNAAMRGVNSHILLPAARDCAGQQPDLFILYLGNNEVVGLHAPGPDSTLIDRHLVLIRATQWLKSFKLGQWLGAMGGKSRRKDSRPQDMEFFREHRIALDEPARVSVYQNFQANLEEMLQTISRSGAKAVLSTVAVNQRDFPPLGSLHRAGLSATEKARWDGAYARGVAADSTNQPALALEQFLAAAKIDDHHAELHYRLARSYGALGRIDEARRHYALARDRDALAFRAEGRVNEVIRSVAAKHRAGTTLVDAERAFAGSELSEQGVPGGRLFHDHVHLKFDGDYLLATTLFPAVAAALGQSLPTNSPLPSRDACAAALGFTKWHELQIDLGVVASRNRPPFLDQMDHAQNFARDQQALQVRQSNLGPGETEQAKASLLTAIANNPGDWQLRHLLAGMASALKDFNTAVENYAFEVNLFPNRLVSRLNFASALAQAGQAREAVVQFNEVLRLDPDNEAARKAIAAIRSRSNLKPR